MELSIYNKYIKKFNKNDVETVKNLIDNANALEFLNKNAPKLYCPDKTIEETFAFRTWTYRKHLKETTDGLVVTEFLPQVSWAGPHNTISAALCFHLDEGRWFLFNDKLVNYIDFFLCEKGHTYRYFTPALYSIINFLTITGNFDYIENNIEKFERYFSKWEERHLLSCGLYWSVDDYDAMEFSISGRNAKFQPVKGLRPTLNSYMYADAIALSKVEKLLNRNNKAEYYENKAQTIKIAFEKKLWDGDFFKAVHINKEYIHGDWEKYNDEVSLLSVKDLTEDNNARELIGYLPFAYNLASKGKEKAFLYLKDENVFNAKTGFATAEIAHKKFLYSTDHDCLWNGYVWPYATSQTINAVISLLNNYKQNYITNFDLYSFIKKFAEMHYLYKDGQKINFIDEMMHPFIHRWETRQFKIERAKNEDIKFEERGKDYNHSSFIDLVIRGLCGVNINSTELDVKPKIKGIWKWFKLENLPFKKGIYDVYYDEDGTVFNKGKGVIIEKR
ncbi:MAG: hypothetical protein J6V68_03485 [Clostridia bacterium]|nr:hypothetical protein [Clostridia bacterium]